MAFFRFEHHREQVSYPDMKQSPGSHRVTPCELSLRKRDAASCGWGEQKQISIGSAHSGVLFKSRA